jgi:hypothetical protein
MNAVGIDAQSILAYGFRDTIPSHRLNCQTRQNSHQFGSQCEMRLPIQSVRQSTPPESQHTPTPNQEHYPETSLDLSNCVCLYPPQCSARKIVQHAIHAIIEREHGDEDPLTAARFQKHSRHIRSKVESRQFGHGQFDILARFPRFDDEHEYSLPESEHNFTDREHATCDWIPERDDQFPSARPDPHAIESKEP